MVQSESPLSRSLRSRHIQLIALGGTIGVGLLLGSARAIHNAGPGLVLSYAVGGLAWPPPPSECQARPSGLLCSALVIGDASAKGRCHPLANSNSSRPLVTATTSQPSWSAAQMVSHVSYKVDLGRGASDVQNGICNTRKRGVGRGQNTLAALDTKYQQAVEDNDAKTMDGIQFFANNSIR
jgi:hypothetical protein